jgi:cysteine desulfurase
VIYLDHHATTPTLPEVREAMRPFEQETFGNPASAHAFGRKARQAVEDARERIAMFLGAFPDEVIFTSGATEANNLAPFGLAGEPPGHILASPIEHPCIIEPLRQLATRGFDIEWLPIERDGSVNVAAVRERMRPDTKLITLMMVNHETGAIQPVRDAAREARAPFHTDAAQCVGKLPMAGFHELGVTSLSASGHKFGGPKGIGLLLLKRGTVLRPLLFGGHQQRGHRPGTEPVALIVGVARALEICQIGMQRALSHVGSLRSAFLEHLLEGASPIAVHGSLNGSPFVANISFHGCRAELLLMKLDLMGVACSTGSACSSGSLLPSPVLRSMGVPDPELRSAMRFSFAATTTQHEIAEAARLIIKSVKELRSQEHDAPELGPF